MGTRNPGGLAEIPEVEGHSTANGQLDQKTLSALQLNPNQFAQSQGMTNGGMAPQQAKGLPLDGRFDAKRNNAPAAPAAKTP